jgi:hypothetical protein
MGLSTTGEDNLLKFSADVLRLEIHGSHGLFDVAVWDFSKIRIPGLTSKRDITLVRDMVLSYM